MDVTTFLIASLILLAIFLWFQRHDSSLPPCPATPLPILGHLLYMDKNPRPQFKKWRKKCGDIYTLYLGQYPVVVLNGFDLIKEALVKHADICRDRPYVFFDASTGKSGLGVSFASGENWKEHRMLTVNILKALGIGRNILVEKVTDVVTVNNEVIAKLKGKATDLDDIITTSVTNIICSVIFGQRFDYEDKEFLQVCNDFKQNLYDADGSNLANYFKFWPYIPGDVFGAKKIQARAQYFMTNFAEPFIRKKGYEEFDENNLDNFIAMYMMEMKKKQNSEEPTTMSFENLKKLVFDIFVAGMETTTTVIRWTLLYFLHYPEIQDKIFSEIEREIGMERMPSMSDKVNLNYLNAFIMELQRITSIVPLNVLHLCSDDLPVGGYVLPKGTQIMPSLDSIFFDKKLWGEDTNAFRPERFLEENGKVKNLEYFVPFSMGRRQCPGEALAKVELFLFLSAMVQRFKFVPEDPKCLPSLEALFGLTATPAHYKIRALDRKAEH